MEKIEFYNDGKYEKYNEINGIKQGKAVYYWGKNSDLTEKHENYGKIKEEFFYENGIKQGKGITYFDQTKTKKIKEEFFYVDNIKHGESFLLYSDRLEKRTYINGQLTGKILVYKLNGKTEIKNYDISGDTVKEKFRTLKEILGIEPEEKEKMGKREYEALKSEAEKRFKETAYSYTENEKLNQKNKNIIPELFIKKYYSKYREVKF